jgi:hypothetical protein
MTRFIRKADLIGTLYDVYIDGVVVGTIEFDGGYYMPRCKNKVLPQCLWLQDAAVAIADAMEG